MILSLPILQSDIEATGAKVTYLSEERKLGDTIVRASVYYFDSGKEYEVYFKKKRNGTAALITMMMDENALLDHFYKKESEELREEIVKRETFPGYMVLVFILVVLGFAKLFGLF